MKNTTKYAWNEHASGLFFAFLRAGRTSTYVVRPYTHQTVIKKLNTRTHTRGDIMHDKKGFLGVYKKSGNTGGAYIMNMARNPFWVRDIKNDARGGIYLVLQ
jgi:hypothetical protein